MSHLKIRRTVAALSVSAVAAVGLAACGSDDSDSSNGGSGENSSQDEGGDEAETEGDTGIDGAAEGDEVDPAAFSEAYADAAAAVETARIDQVTEAGGQEQSQTGVARFDPENLEMELEITTGGQTQTALVVDGTMYIAVDPSGSQYASVDLTDPSNPLGASITVIADQQKTAQAFGEAATSITYDGVVDVDGVEAQEYTTTIDTAAYYTSLGLDDFAALVEQGQLPEELTQLIAFDEEGRVVRTTQDVPATGGVPESSTTTTYSDFGVEVDVEAPDPSTVTPLPGAGA
ncbi:hypothetical protein RDV89_06060 [Nocardioides zeae]|uniref:LppX_LprAFG lipoprotein n=1 Tax=Nocardioides imazamoxiresistens TaxID=3231893 RepID=A0ABU3PV33_9ACTN|nr:hypothetical protein [Nocardioides zeae]MDT9592620.1 hypothetical protein [Nocardioides zeae]